MHLGIRALLTQQTAMPIRSLNAQHTPVHVHFLSSLITSHSRLGVYSGRSPLRQIPVKLAAGSNACYFCCRSRGDRLPFAVGGSKTWLLVCSKACHQGGSESFWISNKAVAKGIMIRERRDSLCYKTANSLRLESHELFVRSL